MDTFIKIKLGDFLKLTSGGKVSDDLVSEKVQEEIIFYLKDQLSKGLKKYKNV